MFSTQQQQFTQDTYQDLKRQKLEEFRDYHQNLLTNLGVSRLDFNFKIPFYDRKGRNVIGIFPSEFRKPNGFYFELATRDYNPLSPNRTVYKIPSNFAYEDEYELNDRGSYLVPLEELRAVNSTGPVSAFNEKPPVSYKAPSPMEDAPMSEMTIRDYIAIHTGKPISAKVWINEIIKSNK